MKKKQTMLHFPRGSMAKILLRMKLLTVLMLAVFAVSAADSYSQATKFNLRLTDVSVKQVFGEIEENSEFILLYNERIVDVNRKVDIKVKNEPVETVLGQIFNGTQNAYRIYDRQIVILENEKAEIPAILKGKMAETETLQQQKGITGKVTEEGGLPLPGVSIVVKGTTIGTVTNSDGEFSLDIPLNAEVLQFSFVGMKAQEVVIGNQTNFTVVMEEEIVGMDEVVVVGYGTQKKVNLTGAVDQISSEVLENRPVIDLSTAVQGVVPNLNISTLNGQPGSAPEYNIRGFTSINGGSPLILVDGVEMEPNMINVNDIQSVTVLKDAGSAAIYGARAAFGVILIETKKGKAGLSRLVYNGTYSFSNPTILPDLVENSYDQAVAINEASFNNNGGYAFSEDRLAQLKAFAEDPINNPEWELVNGTYRWNGYSDWKNILIRRFTPMQKHSLSLSGGSERTTFYASMGYSKMEGLYKQNPDNYEKLNVNLSIQDQTFSWLRISSKIGFDFNGTNTLHSYKQDENPSSHLVFSTPFQPFKYEGDDPAYQGRYFVSPGSTELLGGRDLNRVNHLLLNTGITINVNDYMSIISDINYNLYRNNSNLNSKRIAFLKTDFTTEYGETNNDFIELRNLNSNYYSFNLYSQYERTFIEKLYFKGMIGFNQELNNSEWFSAQRFDLINPEQPAINLATGTQTVNGNQTQWALRGYFTRLNLIFNEKYMFEFNGRYDGSSRFPKNTRYGFFPSFSVGWRLSEESFLAGVEALSNLKLRGSYGSLGNQNFSYGGSQSYYPHIPSMSSARMNNYLLTNTADLYINPPGLVSPSLTWESAKTVNFGIDIGLIKNRLEANFDIYSRTTSDMLITVSYPHVLGVGSPPQNGAELQTKGWELLLNWRENLSNQLKWSLKFVLSDNLAQITKYENTTGTLGDYYVGQKIGEIWGYETVGIFQNNEEIEEAASQNQLGSDWQPGDIRYKNLNDDETINSGDYTIQNPGDLKIIGNSTPRYSFGFGSDMEYKGIFLNIFFQGVAKRDYWPGVTAFWPFVSEYLQVQKHFLTDTWNENNRDAYFSIPLTGQNKNRLPQSRYLQNASYVRLKNLTIGYNIPTKVLSKVGIQKCQVYLSGQNLWEYSKIGKPLDPEINLGPGYLGYPYQRTYAVGINVTI